MRKFCLLAALILLAHGFTLPIQAAPSLSASAAVLMEESGGRILMDVNAHTRMPMASTTKIMTAIVALESTDVQKTVTVSEKAVGIEGSSVYLKAGEELTMEQLLYALLLESANDAAAAIAIEIAGDISAFSDMMNETAKRIGLTETHFTNPHGLDDEMHYTTAYDLALLASYALKNETFRKIVSTHKTTVPLNGSDGTRLLVNHNKMLKIYDGAIGVKTGYTRRSGRCLVSAAERDGVTMIAVTLSAPDDWHDHTSMLDYGFSLYEAVSLAEVGDYCCTLDCFSDSTPQISASNHTALRMVLPKNRAPITVKITANRPLCAPISAGDEIGEIQFFIENEQIASLPLCADTDLLPPPAPKTVPQRIKEFFTKNKSDDR